MSALQCIVYQSTAIETLSNIDLEFILEDSRKFNEEVNVTGVIIYSNGRFFQYIEGQSEDLIRVYDRIKKSRYHRDIIELLDMPVPERFFPQWAMGFVQPQASGKLDAANTQWWQSSGSRLFQAAGITFPPGILLLREFFAAHIDI